MKNIVRLLVLLVVFGAALAGLWVVYLKVDAAGAAVQVDGHVLTRAEMRDRAVMLLNDAKRNGVFYKKDFEKEALKKCERDVASRWIFKELMLDAAVARGISVTPADAEEHLKQMEKELKNRKMTMDEYFKQGPVSEEILRREFDEVVLVRKLLKQEVSDKITLDPKDIDKRLEELVKAAEELNKKKLAEGKQPLKSPGRKYAIDVLRAERYREGVKALYQSLLKRAIVKSADYPDLAKDSLQVVE